MTTQDPNERSTPKPGSATIRRELRRKVRNMLGNSRDEAPSAVVTLKALESLTALLAYATNGRYSVKLIGPHGAETVRDAINREGV